ITNGNTESYPDISPDGRWVAYTSFDKDLSTIWKTDISRDASAPIQLTRKPSTHPSISPDGKLIACFYQEFPTLGPKIPAIKIAIISSTGGEPIKFFDVGPSVFLHPGLHWRPDGRTLTYIDTHNNISNIWSQSLDGGAPKELTHFNSEQIFRF